LFEDIPDPCSVSLEQLC